MMALLLKPRIPHLPLFILVFLIILFADQVSKQIVLDLVIPEALAVKYNRTHASVLHLIIMF